MCWVLIRRMASDSTINSRRVEETVVHSCRAVQLVSLALYNRMLNLIASSPALQA